LFHLTAMAKKKLSKREEIDKLLKKAGFIHVQKTGAILIPLSKKQVDTTKKSNEK
jgi:hypothetical protein